MVQRDALEVLEACARKQVHVEPGLEVHIPQPWS